MNVYYVLLVFLLVWPFFHTEEILPRTRMRRKVETWLLFAWKNMAPIKKAKQKKNWRKQQTKHQRNNFVVYIQRRTMESILKKAPKSLWDIFTHTHTRTHSYLYVCTPLRYLHSFIHSVHDSEVLPISCRRNRIRKQHTQKTRNMESNKRSIYLYYET